MDDQQTESPEPDDGGESRARTLVDGVAGRVPGGSLLAVLGAALLARALWSQQRARALLGALAGAGLLAVGLRKRRSTEEDEAVADAEPVDVAGTGTAEERAESHRGTGPREAEEHTDGPDSDEESVAFTTDQEDGPSSGPTLDDATAGDPRLDETDTTEVDISEASMAGEPGEAVGPAPEQSQPTRTEGTEPEPTPPEGEPERGQSGEQPDQEERVDSGEHADSGERVDSEDQADQPERAESEEHADREQRPGEEHADREQRPGEDESERAGGEDPA